MYAIPKDERENYFRGEVGTPYHLSIGAVVFNDKSEILTHYFKRSSLHDLDDIYILMRETLLPNETLEEAVKRGLKEEFGVIAKMESFIGSLVSHFPGAKEEVEKTTGYFLCQYVTDITGGRAVIDEESTSELQWLQPEELANKMRKQGERTGRSDLDESKIVLRAATKLH